MVTDTAETRKVDKKTALALWDQTIPPPVVRKRRGDDAEDIGYSTGAFQGDASEVMKFTLFTKRGNKPQVAIFVSASYNRLTLDTDEATRYTSRVCLGSPDSHGTNAR